MKEKKNPRFSNVTRLRNIYGRIKNLFLWRVDRFLRYNPIVLMLRDYDENLSILEVGSGSRGITAFWPRRIDGVDIDFSESSTGFFSAKKGSILRLPLKDEEYSVVLCVDTLEHIKPANRKKAISELIRVTKHLLILAFPSGAKAMQYDRLLYDEYKKRVAGYHRWMDEHKRYGFPEVRQTINLIKRYSKQYKKKIKNVEVYGNCNLNFWLSVNRFLFAKNYYWFQLKNKLFFPFQKILSSKNTPPYYRKIIKVEF